ncbi:hypothetical protein D6783_03405 [Candidatus Woesearchaeota archaeon]|nr:MAG: hypothetical protein D6783_03405 [Candidatus Woesearchaeota archaeon]
MPFSRKTRQKRREARKNRFSYFLPHSKRGIAPAIIIIAALVLGTVVLVTNSNVLPPREQDEFTQQRANVELAIDRAVQTGAQKFALYGFSNEDEGTDVWYCNAPLPPGFGEVRYSLKYYVMQELRNYLDSLEAEEGVHVEGPTAIETSLDEYDADTFNYDQLRGQRELTITPKGLIITYQEDDKTIKQEVKSSFTIDFNWDLYLAMRDWMKDDAGELSEKLYDLMTPGTCGTTSCCCDPLLDSAKPEALMDYALEADDVENVIKQAVQELQDAFPSSTGVTCTYKILPGSGVRNDIYTVYSNTNGCTPTCSADNPDISQDEYHKYDMTDAEVSLSSIPHGDPQVTYLQDYFKGVTANGNVVDLTEPGDTRPYKDKPHLNYGCPVDPDTEGALFGTGTVLREQINKGTAYAGLYNVNPPLRPINKLWEDIYEDDIDPNSNHNWQERSALTKKAAVLLTVTCADPSIQMETKEGFTDFTAQIKLRMDVQAFCPPPTPLNEVETNECGGLGSGPPGVGGLQCNPLSCVQALGGTEECWECAPLGGQGVIDIGKSGYGCQPSLTLCGGNCGMCNQAGECEQGAAPPGTLCSDAYAKCPMRCEGEPGSTTCQVPPEDVGRICVQDGTDQACVTRCSQDGKCDVKENEGASCHRGTNPGVCEAVQPFGYLQCKPFTYNPPDPVPPPPNVETG